MSRLKDEIQSKIVVPRYGEDMGFKPAPGRSARMKRVKATKSKPELKLRQAIWNVGLRYRKNYKNLPGSPDIVIIKYKLIVFVDGDFWHGHDWDVKKLRLKHNVGYWIPKIERNIQRDRETNEALTSLGWLVLRFWEHQVNQHLGTCLKEILASVDERFFELKLPDI
ncbi:very short patch repair endonuclease [Spirosoma harenae]